MLSEFPPDRSLPFPNGHTDAEAYVESLLHFVTSSGMLQTLCGGVHILDFLTREPDLYETILPEDWRAWLKLLPIADILDLLMKEDIDHLLARSSSAIDDDGQNIPKLDNESQGPDWRGYPVPPMSLLEYIHSIRLHLLDRSFSADGSNGIIDMKSSDSSRKVLVGMKPKKLHEVQNFATFVNGLTTSISAESNHSISHIVDFGSGQNYLGRVLASPPYRRNVIAVEGRELNIEGAKRMDVSSRLTEKKVVFRNKKLFRETGTDNSEKLRQERALAGSNVVSDEESPSVSKSASSQPTADATVQYVSHRIEDGDLKVVTDLLKGNIQERDVETDPQLMVISLHSCGNLLHHGLRSLVMNPSVKSVAMIGCCYNLLTERLGPPTYKTPDLRPQKNPRIERISGTEDPHGFPISSRFVSYKCPSGDTGIRFNITARMMGVQAPQNWTKADSEGFFTRHFYRALLQRIFLDRGLIVEPQALEGSGDNESTGRGGGGSAIIIGSLRKACYTSFVTYVRGAMAKIGDDTERGFQLKASMECLTDQCIQEYESKYQHKRHQLCIIWSLMAFSAGVVEAAIVVDRWLYLKEQKEIKHCWVQSVFEYKHSPRNLVVVGIKK